MKWQDNLRKEVLDLRDQVISIRRDFHKHPELSFKEHRTAGLIEKYLNHLGLKSTRMAQTGIIATIEGKYPGRAIALRADMDGIPVEDGKDCDYKSCYQGISHACGHDSHMAILLALATILVAKKNILKGSIRFIFQPAEENQGGALPMIEQGCLENPKIEQIYGLHLWGTENIGIINTLPGCIMAATAEFEIEIKGIGGHGAHPEQANDSIVIACQFITMAQSIISRNISPLEAGVITFGTIQGGTIFNVIASSVKLSGTIRARSDDNLNYLKSRMEEVLKGICLAHNTQYLLNFTAGYPALINDSALSSMVKEVAIDLVGSDNFIEHASMGGEDFSYYSQKIPACYMFIGGANKDKGIIYPNHHSLFDIDEDSMLLAIEMMLRILEKNKCFYSA